jgi:hypothetical protein
MWITGRRLASVQTTKIGITGHITIHWGILRKINENN